MRLHKAFLLLTLATLALLQGCKAPTKANYGVTGCYALDEGEHQVSIGQTEMQLYEEMCYIEGLELPINRAFKGHRDAFIAMGFSMSLPDFHRALEADSSFTLVEKAEFDAGGVLYRKHILSKAGKFLVLVVFIEPKFDHVVVYDVIFNAEAEARTYYTDHASIINKLTCGSKQ